MGLKAQVRIWKNRTIGKELKNYQHFDFFAIFLHYRQFFNKFSITVRRPKLTTRRQQANIYTLWHPLFRNQNMHYNHFKRNIALYNIHIIDNHSVI